jgi:hypothetical protein
MTNCLFSEGIEAMTAQLNVRYHEMVETGHPMTVEAVLRGRRGKLCELDARVLQEDMPRATATARFLVVTVLAPKTGSAAGRATGEHRDV